MSSIAKCEAFFLQATHNFPDASVLPALSLKTHPDYGNGSTVPFPALNGARNGDPDEWSYHTSGMILDWPIFSGIPGFAVRHLVQSIYCGVPIAISPDWPCWRVFHSIHRIQYAIRLMHSQHWTFRQNIQVIVSHNRCNFNNLIVIRIQTCHFQVNPNQAGIRGAAHKCAILLGLKTAIVANLLQLGCNSYPASCYFCHS